MTVAMLCLALTGAPGLQAGIRPANNVPLMEQAAMTRTAEAQAKMAKAEMTPQQKLKEQNERNTLCGQTPLLLLTLLLTGFFASSH